jgi:squalene-hopene/tetraprenyl-beta-curcumene cyclase
MLDDLRDWKEDLQSGTPSLVLVRAAGEKPAWASDEELENITSEIGRRIFYGGHASYILNLAITELDNAISAIETWPDLAWLAIHKDLRNECALLQEDLERIVIENVHRLVKQEPTSLLLPPPKNAWQALAWPALLYIVEQWNLGYGEARHIMEFPPELGLGGPQYQRGDTFQRALIADTLCDANRELNDALRVILDNEVVYLLSRRGPDVGGWAYFPDLPELPPDADDLAQVMQVLWSSGHRREITEYCNSPLSIILEGAHADGSFETWIIPLSNRTVRETRQLDCVHRMWGTGADPDVMANLLYALALIDRKGYSKEIERGVRYLMKRQLHDGSWESTWYHGPYYGTYASLRLLSQVEFARDSVQKAAAFLRRSQNPDAGWGLGVSSNALDTSLALLGLATLQKDALDSRQDLVIASHALNYLRQEANSNGSLPSCKFIQMEVGRATQGPSQMLSYGSRTITTVFALKAALAWHNI